MVSSAKILSCTKLNRVTVVFSTAEYFIIHNLSLVPRVDNGISHEFKH
jgi:hypothetical protein